MPGFRLAEGHASAMSLHQGVHHPKTDTPALSVFFRRLVLSDAEMNEVMHFAGVDASTIIGYRKG